jgi:Ca-activated chloride channel family protein
MSTKGISVLITLFFAALCIVLIVVKLKKPGDMPSAPKGVSVKGKPREGALTLQFHSSSAKKSWIDAVTDEFNQKKVEVDGKPIAVKVTHVNSGDSLQQIKDGVAQPEIWSPGDDSWIRLSNEYWRNVHSRAFIQNAKPLVNVPLVIAMWEPMAKTLGYPDKPLGWTDIARLAANPKGWAVYGHPEWGKFKWGHAHPEANSGFLTVLSEIYAFLGKTSGMTVDDLKNPKVKDFLKTAESAVEHYGLSNSWIDTFMRTKGPGYLSAATQYENTIIESNKQYGSAPFKLVAIYPKEGAFWTQHPVGIPDADWVTPEERKAGEIYIDYLLQDDAQRKAMELGLRPIRKDLRLASPFTEELGVKRDIDASKIFDVPDERILKRVRELWDEAKMPASIALLLDISGSMQGEPLENAKKGAILFIDKMNKWDELEVITFSDEITRLAPLDKVQNNGEVTKTRIQTLFAQSGTRFFDAMQEGLDTVRERMEKVPNRRYGLVVLSDGQDTRSKLNKYDFIDKLPTGDNPNVIKLFTIAYGGQADKELLTEIANATNARMFQSTAQEIGKVYLELSANF